MLEFIDAIDLVRGKISSQNIPCIIAGDVNIDVTKCRINNYINDLLIYNFLLNVVLPTRIREKSAMLIDHICRNEMPSLQLLV